MKFVEYDAEGNIFHICEALIADPSSEVNPALFGAAPNSDSVKNYEKRLADHQALGRSLQLASLIDSDEKFKKEAKVGDKARGIHILSDNEPFPVLAEKEMLPRHKWDHASGKLRPLTVEEKKSHLDASAVSRTTP